MTTHILAFAKVLRPAEVAASPPFARVEVHHAATAVAEAWGELESCAPCSVYQTRAFVRPWAETLGQRAGMRPFFILACDAEDRPTALLALGLLRRGPFLVASWLGGRDANLQMALLRRPSDWTGAHLRELLREAARAAGPLAPHAFVLPNQPFAFAGHRNPFSQLPGSSSPSAAYGTVLPGAAETLFAAKLSKDTRKKLRKKEAKLATLGAVSHLVAATPEERADVIDAFLRHKTARFRARGIASDVGAPEMRAFIEAASDPSRGDDGAPGLELHALLVGGRIVATYGGGAHGGQWSGMFNAFDADEEIARSSPGDLLLMRIIARCCARGIARFDLGIGEARYKAALCDETIALFDAVVPVTLAGRAFALAFGLQQAAKRRIKRDPRLLALALRLRRRLG